MDWTTQHNPIHDLHPPKRDFRADVLRGLERQPKRLPSMYFYDERGSELFDRICKLEEYYPTRTEMTLLANHVEEIARCIGPRASVVELGSGSSEKTTILLRALREPHGYVPVDISRAPLLHAAERIAHASPGLEVQPVCADFMREFDLPERSRSPGRRVVFFPGSTIGNFGKQERLGLFRRVSSLCAREGLFLIGFDLVKERARLERAYNDDSGVTAAFNLNLLERINRELGANFDVARFRHRAHYDALRSRIEMHLVSQIAQRVRVADREFEFRAGESICTEHSYKFTVDGFLAETAAAGFRSERVFMDGQRLFAVALLAHETPRRERSAHS